MLKCSASLTIQQTFSKPCIVNLIYPSCKWLAQAGWYLYFHSLQTDCVNCFMSLLSFAAVVGFLNLFCSLLFIGFPC